MSDDASQPKHHWIKEGLLARGYEQRDLAKSWGISDASVSRFIAGQENQGLSLERAIALAHFLGISTDELARGLGLMGKLVIPSTPTPEGSLPVGTLKLEVVGSGVMRLVLCQDLTGETAAKVVALVASGAVDPQGVPPAPVKINSR